MASFSDCYGCSLCLLSCPMWLQRRDVRFSVQGYAKAMQHGADAMAIKEPLSACIECGACQVVCPEHIDVMPTIAQLKGQAGLSLLAQSSQEALSGFVMSCDDAVQQQLGKDDLYIIDAAGFHAHHAGRVEHYTQLRDTTGCSMNLDLQRLAIPTGSMMLNSDGSDQLFDVEALVSWLIQGRSFERLVVENPADQAVLAKLTGKPVVQVKDLFGSNQNHAES